MTKHTLALLLALCAVAPAASQAASFDCNKARTVVELLICSDPFLSALDEKSAKVYYDQLEAAPQPQKASVRQQQRDFLKERIKSCPPPMKDNLSEQESNDVIRCLKGLYTAHIESMQNESPAAPLASALPAPATSAPANEPPAACPAGASRSFYSAACASRAAALAGKNALQPDLSKNMEASRSQLDCAAGEKRQLQQSAEMAASRILSSGAISKLMDFGDAIRLECEKAANNAIK